ncbi:MULTISPECIES: hypothetical protein [unclassified Pseudoalteromonas]|uniref:hypothetical protein n=1 Tax=unclassified Pseudoalteromonas TaxID=194690 RepID=UPI000465F2CC|nr:MULTISPECIES: hypothetical protein [unclassified Pseudoalteromonas]
MGCSLYDLHKRLSADELELRLVHQGLKMGLTFDRSEQRKIEYEQKRRETEAFLNTCPWRKQKRN